MSAEFVELLEVPAFKRSRIARNKLLIGDYYLFEIQHFRALCRFTCFRGLALTGRYDRNRRASGAPAGRTLRALCAASPMRQRRRALALGRAVRTDARTTRPSGGACVPWSALISTLPHRCAASQGRGHRPAGKQGQESGPFKIIDSRQEIVPILFLCSGLLWT